MQDEHKMEEWEYWEDSDERKFRQNDLWRYGFEPKEVIKGNVIYFSIEKPDTTVIPEAYFHETHSLESLVSSLSNIESGSLDTVIFADVVPQEDFYSDSHRLDKLWIEAQRVLKKGGRSIIIPLELDEDWDIRHVADSLSIIERHAGGDCEIDFPRGNHSVGELVMIKKSGKLETTSIQQEVVRISRDAVQKALEYAYGTDRVGYDINEKVVKGHLVEETKDLCDRNSRKVIRFMFQRYPDQFDRMFILESSSDKDFPFKQGFSNHTLFVLRDLSGKWYVGSPSNYSEEFPDTLTEFFEEDSLEEAVSQYQQKYGGDWGDTLEIERMTYVHPVKNPWLNVRDQVQLSAVSRYIYSGDTSKGEYTFSTKVDQES